MVRTASSALAVSWLAATRCPAGVWGERAGEEVVEPFRAKFPEADSLFQPTRDGHALVDLHEANRRQLVEAGVEPGRIHALPLCTMCRPDLFFSYRQDRKLYGRTGRLLSVIGMRA